MTISEIKNLASEKAKVDHIKWKWKWIEGENKDDLNELTAHAEKLSRALLILCEVIELQDKALTWLKDYDDCHTVAQEAITAAAEKMKEI